MTDDAEHDEALHIATLGPLTEQQLAAIDLLVAGKNATEVADAVHAHRTTLSRWRKHPGFREALRLRRAEVRDAARTKLEAHYAKAVDALGQLLDDPNARIRLDAAKAVLAASASAEDAVDPYDPIALPGGGTGRYSGATEVLPVPGSLSSEERETVRNLLVALRRAAEASTARKAKGNGSNGNGGRVVGAVQKRLPIPGPAVDADVTTFE